MADDEEIELDEAVEGDDELDDELEIGDDLDEAFDADGDELHDDDDDDDGAGAKSTTADDDDDDEPDPDDVEEDLDTILKDRLDSGDDLEDEEDEEDEVVAPPIQATEGDKVAPKREDEWTCTECFLIVSARQFGQKKHATCPSGVSDCPSIAKL